jgi:arylsulfate sulfotransferase
VDLAGNTVIETTQGAVNEQLQAMGKPRIRAFHHDVRRIYTGTGAAPEGYIVALVGNERISTSAQGGTPQNPVLILGDAILVLNSNLEVVWFWDPFEHLDMNVSAIFNDKCSNPGGPGCVGFNPAFTQGNDWLHSNSVKYSPYDGNIIFSARHQDSVIKVNFANGQGDGRVLWKLGNGPIRGVGGAPLPTFRVVTNNTIGPHDIAYPWFSHQHDAEIQFGGAKIGSSRILSIFDNGNTRRARFNPAANSRCQIFAINEDTLVANLNRNADLGVYAFAVGSAQILGNNNTVCHSGFVEGAPVQTTESGTDANPVHTLISSAGAYRAWRLQDLYTPPNP